MHATNPSSIAQMEITVLLVLTLIHIACLTNDIIPYPNAIIEISIVRTQQQTGNILNQNMYILFNIIFPQCMQYLQQHWDSSRVESLDRDFQCALQHAAK